MEQEIKSLIYKSIYWIIGLLVVIFGISIFLREPISQISKTFVENFGILGVGLGIALSDALPGILLPDAFLVFGIAGNLPDIQIILASGIGSLIGGSLSYIQGGYIIPKVKIGKEFIDKHEEKLIPYVEKYGIWAVVLASITPLPYSWMAILVGSFKMPFYKFILASLFRVIRFVIYFYAIKLGWTHEI